VNGSVKANRSDVHLGGQAKLRTTTLEYVKKEVVETKHPETHNGDWSKRRHRESRERERRLDWV